MKTAIDYASLVGKYVSMARTPDEVEYLEAKASYGTELPSDYSVGGDGLVILVYDDNSKVGGPSVAIMFDYGMGFNVFPEDDWRFSIFNDEEDIKHSTHLLQR